MFFHTAFEDDFFGGFGGVTFILSKNGGIGKLFFELGDKVIDLIGDLGWVPVRVQGKPNDECLYGFGGAILAQEGKQFGSSYGGKRGGYNFKWVSYSDSGTFQAEIDGQNSGHAGDSWLA